MSRTGRHGPAEPEGTAESAGRNWASGAVQGPDGEEDGGPEDGPETVRIDARPSRTGTAVAGLVGAVAVAAQAAGGPAVAVGGVGLAALVAGLRRGIRRLVSLGVLGLILGVLVAGAVGVPAELLLVSAAASAVAWDVATQAVSLGEQVGRDADTARAELVHAAGSALVATVAVAAAYLVFATVTGGPVLALVLLLLGAILLASVLGG
ncbi:MAG: hypothetical protein V5A62_15590 [Haloarculaceae archaeon]